MAEVVICDLEDALIASLRRQATSHGQTIEHEARDILRAALSGQTWQPGNLAAAIRARFAPFGGLEAPTVGREPIREPPTFSP